MKTKIFIILGALSLFACKKILNIDIKDNEKKIVMQSILMPDSTIKVNLSKSLGLLESSDTIFFLNDAEVKLFEDDVFVENLKYTYLGNYIGSTILNKNKKYKIVAKHPSIKDEASAEINFVDPVPIKNLSYEAEIGTITQPIYDSMGVYIKDSVFNTVTSLIIKVLFDDPKDIENFYLLSITSKQPIIVYDQNTYEADTIGYYDVPVDYFIKGIETEPGDDGGFGNTSSIVLPSISLVNKVYGKVFSDLWFKNTTYTINAKIPYIGYYGTEKPMIYKYKVCLFSIKKDVYYFTNSLNKYYQTQGNPFSEPVNVYSNVNGGFGFVSSISISTDSITIVQ